MTHRHFEYFLDIVLRFEGVGSPKAPTGFIDDPHDPGGITNWGISYRFLKGVNPKATPDDIRNMTREQAEELYRVHFWNAIKGDEIVDNSLALLMFDTAVNMGVGRSIKLFQKAVGLSDDGVIGPKTLAALGTYNRDQKLPILKEFTSRRIKKYIELINFNRYGMGWIRRAVECHQAAIILHAFDEMV